jgi:carbon-monoxide dehydrogenase small subunit
MAKIEFTVNGEFQVVDIDPSIRLLDFLRDYLHLTGSKEGCGEGECGACAVLFDSEIANSCLVPMANVNGHEILTIEGFRNTERYKILEKAFLEQGAVQCGFCTPGMIIAAESLLRKNPHPSEAQIRIGLSGNLCRCTGYNMIVAAVLQAASDGDGLW